MEEVATPFRIIVPAGTSTFDVKVPKHHLTGNRMFYFNHLHVAPDFFNKEVDNHGLDIDSQLDQPVEYPVHIKLEYKDVATFYGPKYSNSSTTSTTLELIQEINQHFEANKPDPSITTPFFIDWIDTELAQLNSPRRYVPAAAFIYYNEHYRSGLHDDQLPASVQLLDDVNDFILPIGMKSSMIFESRIRLRLWMAPYTRAVFSSNAPFVEDLGFTEEQFGAPYKNQYHLGNKAHNWRPVLTAANAPKANFTKVDFKITLSPYHHSVRTKQHIITMSKRDWKDNNKVAVYLQSLFRVTSYHLNTVFTFGFIPNEKRFFFNLPMSDNLSVIIICHPEVSLRLGFGLETHIVRGMQAQPLTVDNTILEAQTKALAVVYDTGPIICTLDNISSNTTSGADAQFMAALYPHISGTLSMPESGRAHAVHLNILKQSTSAFVPITFRLLRIYDNEKSDNFTWIHNAYIYGIFSGACITPQTYKSGFNAGRALV